MKNLFFTITLLFAVSLNANPNPNPNDFETLKQLVIIKNVGLTYLRGLKIAELKEEGIPTKLLVLL